MHHRSRSSFVVVALLLVTALAMPANAFALMEDDHQPGSLKSSTNPAVGDDATEYSEKNTWRWSWGNTLYPDLTINPAPTDEGGDLGEKWRTLGFIYEVRQVDPSGVGSATPVWGTSGRATRDGADKGASITGKFDFLSAGYDHGWTAGHGGLKRGEGLYAITWRYYNQFRVEETSSTNLLHYGVDLTNPSPVAGLVASYGSAPAKNGWTEVRRRDVRWTPMQYDALSGVGGFLINLNGEQAAFAHNVGPDPAIEPYGEQLNWRPPGYVYLSQVENATIEDLPAGESTLDVFVVDRATNLSEVRTVKAYVDYDTPKVAILHPGSAGVVSAKPTFTVKAEDEVGIVSVRYYVDDVLIGTSTTAPFSLTADLSGYSDGSHTLKVEALDNIGEPKGATWLVDHIASATRSFVIDKTPPSVSGVVGAPSPFYPVQVDKYRDEYKVSFTTNEAATAKIVIRDSSGKTVRTISKTVAVGANTVVWDGKNSSGSKVGGTYRWSLQLTDAAGNSSASATGSVVLKPKTDETPPKITKVSANYTTFFPRKRDGYKDNLKVKFTTNEAGTAKLTIKNSKGKVVRTVKKTITKAGATSITWNGKYTDGSVKAGTFSYKLSMTDKSANTSSVATRKITIKFYELVRTASNKLKVVER